jgi:hypothetical protein
MERYVGQTHTKDDFIFARDVKTDKHDFYMYEVIWLTTKLSICWSF